MIIENCYLQDICDGKLLFTGYLYRELLFAGYL